MDRSKHNRAMTAAFCLLVLWRSALSQESVHFSSRDRQTEVFADQYGSGTRALILAHGGRFNQHSWKDQARTFVKSGFLVLAVCFRGDTTNPDGSPSAKGSTKDHADDILAAVSYLRDKGAKTISAIGGSLGGDAVGEADARSAPGTFDRVVFLASEGGGVPTKLNGRKLFILARGDRSASGPRLPEIFSHYASAPEPKKLVLLQGSAHAQFLFDTDQGTLLMNTILQFLQAP